MTQPTTSVYGIFYDKNLADRSLHTLLDARFVEEDVAVKNPRILGTKDLADDRESRAGSSMAIVIACVAIGGLIGLALGLGAMALPWVGAHMWASPILGALIGFGVGGFAGGAIDAFDATGLPELGARRYEGHIREGAILLTVHCHDQEEVIRAKELLQRTGAEAVSEAGSRQTVAYAPEDRPNAAGGV